MRDIENIVNKVVDYYSTLMCHKELDDPDDRNYPYTKIWREYLRSGCVAKMTKEEALEQKMLYMFGDLEKDVNKVEQTREYLMQIISDPLVRKEREQEIINRFPYEFLFVYMPL